MSMGSVLFIIVVGVVLALTAWGHLRHGKLLRTYDQLCEQLGLEELSRPGTAVGVVDDVSVRLELENLEEASPWAILRKGMTPANAMILLFVLLPAIAGRVPMFFLFFGGGSLIDVVRRASGSALGTVRITTEGPRLELSASMRGLAPNLLADPHEVKTGDQVFDDAVALTGNAVAAHTILDADTRRSLMEALGQDVDLEKGKLSRALGGSVPAEVVEQAKELIALAATMYAAHGQFERAVERALHDPNEQVRRHAARAVLGIRITQAHRMLVQALLQPYAGRPLVEALEDESHVALAALIQLETTGAPADVAIIRARTAERHPDLHDEAEQAVGAIQARVKGDAAGRVSVASGAEHGGLTIARRGGGLSSPT